MSMLLIVTMDDIKKNLKYMYLRAKSTILPTKKTDFITENPETKDRIINPPEFFIPDGEYKEIEKGFGSRKTSIRVMTTPHGFYVKPTDNGQLFEISYESSFGFGLSCNGFDPERVVYYPNV